MAYSTPQKKTCVTQNDVLCFRTTQNNIFMVYSTVHLKMTQNDSEQANYYTY